MLCQASSSSMTPPTTEHLSRVHTPTTSKTQRLTATSTACLGRSFLLYMSSPSILIPVKSSLTNATFSGFSAGHLGLDHGHPSCLAEAPRTSPPSRYLDVMRCDV